MIWGCPHVLGNLHISRVSCHFKAVPKTFKQWEICHKKNCKWEIHPYGKSSIAMFDFQDVFIELNRNACGLKPMIFQFLMG